MLPAVHRLRRSTDFAATVRGGVRSGRSSLVVHLRCPDTTPSEPAFTDASAPVKAGFVVSRAVGGAVLRNKVKRRLRTLLAERIEDLPTGCTVVVRALPMAGRTPYPQLALDLDGALAAALRRQPQRSRGDHG